MQVRKRVATAKRTFPFKASKHVRGPLCSGVSPNSRAQTDSRAGGHGLAGSRTRTGYRCAPYKRARPSARKRPATPSPTGKACSRQAATRWLRVFSLFADYLQGFAGIHKTGNFGVGLVLPNEPVVNQMKQFIVINQVETRQL